MVNNHHVTLCSYTVLQSKVLTNSSHEYKSWTCLSPVQFCKKTQHTQVTGHQLSLFVSSALTTSLIVLSICPSTVFLFFLMSVFWLVGWYLYDWRVGERRDRFGEQRKKRSESSPWLICHWFRYWRLRYSLHVSSLFILLFPSDRPHSYFPASFLSHFPSLPLYVTISTLFLVDVVPPFSLLCLSLPSFSLWINRRRAEALSDICRNKRLKYKHS